ncbi:MAG: gamma-glutamyltransferase [Bacteriovoracaceae bacterium]|jgi:gamma-glutamyltranspeptidase / glutathione hydrolase|nr:gamma-glutamyltransferase [Bacteriovoracaceae bacterium]
MKIKTLVIILMTLSCSRLQIVDPLAGHKRQEYEASSENYMISTQGVYSSKAGKKMFELGGNAVDAATAISFVISVERPQSTGLGGGGFMLINIPGSGVKAIDFREKAPLKAYEKMYLDKDGKEIPRMSLDGIHAGGVPGLVAGVLEAHSRYGKLPIEKVLAPAIELAEKGFDVYPELAFALNHRKKVLARFPSSKAIFLHSDGTPLIVGEKIFQKDLAKTLKTIVKKGKNGFYRGWVAKAIVKESKKRGGFIRYGDLRRYNVKWREPVVGKYKGLDIYSMSPPSSGGVHVVQILNILEGLELKKFGPQSPKSIHYTASAMQLAFADRAKYLGDADFVKVPVKGLTSKAYAKELRAQIQPNTAKKMKAVDHGNPFPYESSETTHFTVMDRYGFVVSSTQTINGLMGSGLVIPGTGIVLNNEMDDFATKVGAKNLFGAVGGEKNLVESEKRPLSSMSPTIVLNKGKPVIALGTPSGTRILTCVAQVLLNYLEHELPLYESVAATRIHHQWYPDSIRIGPPYFNDKLLNRLKGIGYKINKSPLHCRIQAISNEEGKLHGVSDPRGEGLSIGG